MPTFEYGDRMTVRVLSQRSDADWGSRAKAYDKDVNYYSPPPGWAILSNRVIVHSQNNGSHGVSTFAGGSNFEERHLIEETFDHAINAAAQAQDYSAMAAFEQEKQMILSSLDAYSASHNTLKLETEAWKAGKFYDRWGGWSHVSVDVELMFICLPGCAGELEQRLQQRIKPQPVIGTGVITDFRPHRADVINNFDPAIFGPVSGRSEVAGRIFNAMPMNGKFVAQ